MSNYFVQSRMDAASGTLTVSGANTVTYRPGRTAHIQKVVLLTTTAQTGTDNILTIGVRNIDTTGAVSKGTVTIATATSLINQVLHIDVVKPKPTGSGTTQSDGSLYYAGYNPGGPIIVKPGQELYITSNGASSAGVYDVRVELLDQGFSGPDVAAALAPVFTGI